MKQIFFIYNDAVVTELAKSILSDNGVNSYAINDVQENFSYLINDLNPEVVLVDEKVYEDAKDLIDDSLKDSNTNSKWVFLTEKDVNDQSLSPFHMNFALPLKAKTLFEDIQYLVDQSIVKN